MNRPPDLSLAINALPAAGDSAPLGERFCATPRLACEALCLALNGGDLGAALACFTPGAALVGANGSLAQGEAALRARLGELIASGVHLEIELRGVIVTGDLALAHERWTISYGGRIDAGTAQAEGPTMVLRLLEGEWRLAIAAPWGIPASAPLRAIWP